MLQHSLYSHEKMMIVAFFDTFNKENIKEQIILHLKENPFDTLEHCKEYGKADIKRYYGNEILNLYENNPANGKPSLIVTKGNKTYYKALSC